MQIQWDNPWDTLNPLGTSHRHPAGCLLLRGSNIDAKDDNQETLLHWASY